MAKFLFVYHKLTHPQDDAKMQEVMQKWQKWLQDNPFIDNGGMVGMSKTINGNQQTADNGGANPCDGYSVVECDTIEQALDIAGKCPFLGSEDHIEVAEIVGEM